MAGDSGWGLWLGPVRGAQGPQRLGGGVVVSTKLDFVKTSEIS